MNETIQLSDLLIPACLMGTTFVTVLGYAIGAMIKLARSPEGFSG